MDHVHPTVHKGATICRTIFRTCPPTINRPLMLRYPVDHHYVQNNPSTTTTEPAMPQLIHDVLIHNLRPSDAKALFDLLSKIYDDRDTPNLAIARAMDELDHAIRAMI